MVPDFSRFICKGWQNKPVLQAESSPGPEIAFALGSPWIKFRFAGELLPQFLFAGGNFFRHDDFGDDHQIAARAGALFQAVIAHAELLPAGRAGGNLDVHFGIQGRHGNLRAERGFPRREFKFVDQTGAVHVEVGMLGETDAQIQIAIFTAAAAAFAATGEAQFLSLADAGGNFHLMRFGAAAVTDVDGAHGTARRFLQRDHDVAFDVRAAFGKILRRKISAPGEIAAVRAAHPRAEQLLEKIAEAGAAEMKFLAAGRASAAKRLAVAEAAMAGRGTELRAGFPVRAQLVVFPALVRVGEDFVGLVDLLEFFLGLFFVLRHVGMKFARELAEGFFYIIRARGARYAEGLVIIFVLNGHGQLHVAG